MKQILQSLKSGATQLHDIPHPQLQPGHILIQTSCSLISAGTEKMLVDFGKASSLEKARQQPDKVSMVFDKIKTDGLLTTIAAVKSKLEQMIPMGYCNVGRVIAVGAGVSEFAIGDRVVSNGPHAEIISVPKRLCAAIPDTLSDESAAFTILGAIALQGIRLAQPTLGESVVVIGLGLIGLLASQLLRAQGCRVLGIDLDPHKIELAQQLGIMAVCSTGHEETLAAAHHFSRTRGVDAVLITAATQSHEPIHQAAAMSRQRGRIILVGVAGLNLSRADFYQKELSFQVSCSYGPGRYDPAYEISGHDYPLGFVRWTQQRNFEAFLDMLAQGALNVAPLISHRFPIHSAPAAYELLTSQEKTLGILLTYESGANPSTLSPALQTVQLSHARPRKALCLGVIGAGNYANRILIPAFHRHAVRLKQIACVKGISGTHVGKKFGIEQVTTDAQQLFTDPAIEAVVIASRHDDHAAFVCAALAAGKHVFVEKPLCLSLSELEMIINQWQQTPQLLMVGFNRRFAPQIQAIKRRLASLSTPKTFIMTVNAGPIPHTHWTQDPKLGGGRIIGEACHFIDLLRFLADARIQSFQVSALKTNAAAEDTASIMLNFADGSSGTIHYFANGHRAFPKERLEIFCHGKMLQLDNFRRLHTYGWPALTPRFLWRQDKGQHDCVAAFINAIKAASLPPIPIAELFEVTKVTLDIATSLQRLHS